MKKIKHLLHNISFMFQYIWRIKPSIFFYGIFDIVLNSLEPFLMLILPKYIIDSLVSGRGWDVILKYTIMYILTFAILKILHSIHDYAFAYVFNSCDVKNGLLYRLDSLNMDYKYLEDDSLQNMVQRVSSNVRALSFLCEVLIPTITNFIRLVGYTYIIASLNPLIILFLLGIIGINSILSKKREKINYEFEPIMARFNRKQSYLFNTMIGFEYAKEVRINQAERWVHEKYDETTGEFLDNNLRLQKKHLSLNITESFSSFAETFVTYVYCAVRAITGSITIGSFGVYVGAISNFSSSFSSFVQTIVHNGYIMKRIDDYFEYRSEIEPTYKKTDPKESPVLTDSPVIEFVNVSFRYPKTEIDVLKNISLKIEGGKRLAIVGYNGAGKTTLIKLLCRLYEPTEGNIFYNGINIKDIKYRDYMEILSVVLQDFKLFSFSALENIVLNRGFDQEWLEYCIEKCGLKEKIDSLPKGVVTSIGREFDEGGIEFSGGEGQKLASARALYKDGKISIMDEPTAALDPIAENELYQRFDQIIGNKTAMYISHRLASARFCDRIVVFAHGELVEEGTHSELMQRGGIYYDMFSKQAEYYREEA